MNELDSQDKKLLHLLRIDARQSNTQLAKKLRMSKPAVQYRLDRFDQKQLIFSYNTLVDFTKLSYSQYKAYFRFQNTNVADEKAMLTFWTNRKNIVWVGHLRGRWDVAVSVLARSNYEFSQILGEFLELFAKFVLEKDVLLTEYSPIYKEEQEGKEEVFTYGIPTAAVAIDEVDNVILLTLSLNARASIVDLMKKTGFSRDVLTYRIKQMRKNGLIIGFSAYPDLEKWGKQLYKIILRMKNFSSKDEARLREYCKQKPKVTQMLKVVGSWDVEIEVECSSEAEYYSILNDIRTEFSNVIREFETLRVDKTLKYDFYPFA
jgi:Lrp/AsnC family leucine-responsive transcriptional regulator